MADRSGYIGRAPGDSSVTIARQNYTPTGIQTDFTFNSGYTVGLIDAYLNGVKLIEANDYTASDGSTVGLTTAAISGDTLELVAYKAFNVNDVNSTPGNFTFGNDFFANIYLISINFSCLTKKLYYFFFVHVAVLLNIIHHLLQFYPT